MRSVDDKKINVGVHSNKKGQFNTLKPIAPRVHSRNHWFTGAI